MKYTKLNNNWDSDPNVPIPTVKLIGKNLILSFKLNYFIYKNAKEGSAGVITFNDCIMYRLGSPNDEGFYLNQFRYSQKDIPWGGFYEIFESGWESTFPNDKKIVTEELKDKQLLHHFLFFFRDETFECIAKSWTYEAKEGNQKIK